MRNGKKSLFGILLMIVLMAVTWAVLFRDKSMGLLWAGFKQINPWFLLPGLLLMFGYVGCEAMCSRLILGRLGHRVPYRRCLGYSFVGFYVSSITPSATGGQPAQIYYMNRDGIPPACGVLNMMLIAMCYQVASLVWGISAWAFMPSARSLNSGMKVLLLCGAFIMLLLTGGMAAMVFFKELSGRILKGGLRLLGKLHLLRKKEAAEEKLERQLAEYARGAACLKQNPLLALRVLGLCLLQQGCLFLVPWVVYLAFGLGGHSFIEIAGVQALLTLAVCNLPLPGAVGAAEGGFVAAFGAIFGAELVTPAMLVARGISFYSFLLISFAAAVIVHFHGRSYDLAVPSVSAVSGKSSVAGL